MSNKTQQTALEFYRHNLMELVSLKKSKFQTENEIYEQAKEMHRQEIINAVDGFPLENRNLNGTEYYNETYGGGEQ